MPVVFKIPSLRIFRILPTLSTEEDLYFMAGESLQNGELFASRYRLEDVLGSGGMGKVYLATDTVLGSEKIALKILNSDLSNDETHTVRFLREVQLTRKVTHPNVVRTFDVGTFNGKLYFTMEHVEGETLRQKVTSGNIPPLEAAGILIQICEGLSSIHDLQIIHRDLKSSNVMLTKDGIIKITDFGVAKPGNSNLTTADELLGSATHIAPEVWREGEVSILADIYALGVVAYELVTGVLPFDGRTPHELMWQHLKQAPTPPISVNPEIPRWFNTLILRMLEKKPEKRPATSREIKEEVKAKIRKSTLEDARKSYFLGTPISEISEQESTLDEGLEVSEEEQQKESLFTEPDSPPSLNKRNLDPLSNLSFTIQPCTIDMENSEDLAYQEGSIASPDSTQNQKSFLQRHQYFLKSICYVIGGFTLNFCILLVSFMWFGPLLSEWWPKNASSQSLFPILLGSLVGFSLMAATLTIPFLPLSLLHLNLRNSSILLVKYWLSSMAAIFSLFSLHLGRLLYWSYEVKIKDLAQISTASFQATIQNILEVGSFQLHGTYHKVVMTKLGPAFLPMTQETVFQALPHFFLLGSYILFISCCLSQSIFKLETRRALKTTALMAALFMIAPSIKYFSSQITEPTATQRALSINFGPLNSQIDYSTLWGALGNWVMLFLVSVLVLVLKNMFKPSEDSQIWTESKTS